MRWFFCCQVTYVVEAPNLKLTKLLDYKAHGGFCTRSHWVLDYKAHLRTIKKLFKKDAQTEFRNVSKIA